MGYELAVKPEITEYYPRKTEFEEGEERRIRLVKGEEARAVLNHALLPLYTSRSLYSLVKSPERIYYRVYKDLDTGDYAVFLLYEWPSQTVPPHKYDYEPVIVVLDKDMEIKRIYTDGFHYYVKKYTAPPLVQTKPYIYVDAPWRSMVVRFSEPRKTDVMLWPVDEVKGDFPQTRVVYLSDRIIDELRSRSENPLSVHPKLIKNPFSVEEAKHWATFREPTPEDLAKDFAKNYGLTRLSELGFRVREAFRALVDRVRAFAAGLVHVVRERIADRVEEEVYA